MLNRIPIDLFLLIRYWLFPKAIVILSDTTLRRSAVDREDLKPYWKSKKGHISPGDQQYYYLHVFKDFTNHRKKTNFLAVDVFPTFLNTRTTDKTFQQSEKQDSLRHLLQS